jgi:hypothetical protein
MIMNSNVMVMDTDSITDPIERKHNANSRLTAKDREALIADEVRSALRELYA